MQSAKRLLLLLPMTVIALAVQAGGNVDMEQVQKMQECMSRIDQSRLEALSARAETMDKEIKALCAAGKRDQAQDRAMEYGREISSAPVMQQMKKCGEMARGMMQQMPMMDDYSDRHVCDSM